MEAATLGQMKGVLDGCTAINPRAASSYLLHMKEVIGSATKAMVDEAEHSEDYQQAYDSVRTQLNALAQDKRVAACESYLSAR